VKSRGSNKQKINTHLYKYFLLTYIFGNLLVKPQSNGLLSFSVPPVRGCSSLSCRASAFAAPAVAAASVPRPLAFLRFRSPYLFFPSLVFVPPLSLKSLKEKYPEIQSLKSVVRKLQRQFKIKKSRNFLVSFLS